MEREKDFSYHNTLIVLLLLVYFFLALTNFLVHDKATYVSNNGSHAYENWVNPDNLD